MKKRVLIVEDDKFFRFAVKKVTDWEKYGFEITGEAVHGAAALEFLENHPAEVVITDMSMPVMNGIELTAAVRERYPDILIIALSAYDDFEFVKESMKLGAQDYILKQDIEKEDVGKLIRGAWEKHMKMLAEDSLMKGHILRYLSGEDISERPRRFLELCLGEQAGYYLCRIENLNPDRQFPDTGISGAGEHLLQDSLLEIRDKNEYVLLLPQKKEHSLKNQIEERDRMLSELERLLAGSKYLGGISRMKCGAAALPSMYLEAGKAKESGRFSGKQRIQIWDYAAEKYTRRVHRDSCPSGGSAAKCCGLRYDSRNGTFLEKKECYANLFTLEEACEALKELTADICSEMPPEDMILKNYLVLLNAAAQNQHFEIGHLEFADMKEQLAGYRLIQDKHDRCLEFLEEIFGNSVQNGMHTSVLQGIQFMRQNYARDLSLGEIADHVALNESYFSGLFKKDTKKSVTEYLNQIRIEKAKELIAGTNSKNYEIAEQVGISNPSYFSTIFKKQTGLTIQEYRQMLLKKQ